MSTSFLRKSGHIALAVLIIAAGIYFSRAAMISRVFLPVIPSTDLAGPLGDLPNMPQKPEPASYTLDGCPPQGDGGDPQLNVLKNRVDRGDYATVSFESLSKLTWPKNIERQPMNEWSDFSRNYVNQYAGLPVKVEGYIVGVREGPPDPAECNLTNSSYLDWHLSFAQNPRDERAQTILAEVTPRVRLSHTWTMDTIHSVIMGDHIRVRLSGWLYLDPEHPGDLGVTRATLWEINPVMQIEMLDNARWVPLDALAR